MVWFAPVTRRTAGTALLLAGAATLTACAAGPANAPPGGPQGVIPASSPANNPEMASAQALLQYDWRLDSASALALPREPSKRPMVRFVNAQEPRNVFAGQVVVNNLCNSQSAPYTLARNTIQLGAGMSTMKACSDASLMQLERALAQQLSQVKHWAITPDILQGLTTEQHPRALTLRLSLADGREWVLQGTPNDALRLGGPPQRVFWEVAPDTPACPPEAGQPSGTATPCLRVRTITYNEQWIKQPPGEWRTFRGRIEGFQHEPGYRKVLRLNHWPKSNTHVLDMVVETELVNR